MGKIDYEEVEEKVELDRDIIRNAEGKRIKSDRIHVPDNYKVLR